MNDFKVATGSIASIKNLAKSLDVSEDMLLQVSAMPDESKYQVKEILKKNGDSRIVYNPNKFVRKLQRRINVRIFSDPNIIVWPHFLYGSIPSHSFDGVKIPRDYIACASVHCEARSLLQLDIENFFDNISYDLVFDVFKKVLKYSDDVSELLANICTKDGFLPQGALTSSYLACLSLHDVENNVVKRLSRKGMQYTRYVDDITISSKKNNNNFDFALRIVEEMLHSKDFPINIDKKKISYASSEPLTVHGLRVSFKTPRLPANEVGRIRASVNSLERMSKEKNYRQTHAYRHDFNKCMGRVNKLARVGHSQHERLSRKLNSIVPLPSKKDVIRVKSMISRLEQDCKEGKSGIWHVKRFYLAHERLNVVQRSYPNIATILRKKLHKIIPKMES